MQGGHFPHIRVYVVYMQYIFFLLNNRYCALCLFLFCCRVAVLRVEKHRRGGVSQQTTTQSYKFANTYAFILQKCGRLGLAVTINISSSTTLIIYTYNFFLKKRLAFMLVRLPLFEELLHAANANLSFSHAIVYLSRIYGCNL